jgi:hypothetical protein
MAADSQIPNFFPIPGKFRLIQVFKFWNLGIVIFPQRTVFRYDQVQFLERCQCIDYVLTKDDSFILHVFNCYVPTTSIINQ